MRKSIVLLLMIFMCTSILSGCGLLVSEDNGEIVYKYDDVKDTLIRFHVIANSDSKEDQELKLKVRDEVIKYLYPLLEKSESIEESRSIINNNEEKVLEIALKVVSENGYDYKVESTLSRENFPEKAYGSVVLPQGNYEAYRIVIGSGQGQNWWCVMFPPLCFIDVTKGQVEDNKSVEALNSQVNHEEKEEEPVFKFKLFEFIKGLFS